MNSQENFTLLKKAVSEIDPIGLIDSETPETFDEYDSEIRKIVNDDISKLDVQQLSTRIQDIFTHAFNDKIAGSRSTYNLIAQSFLKELEKNKS